MTVFAKKAALVPLAALAATLSLSVPQADAQGLFSTLFGNGVMRSPHSDFPPPPSAKRRIVTPRKNAPVAKISGPSYYTYKAAPLVRVDFAALETAAPRPAAFEPMLSGIVFREGLAGLQDFNLYAEKEVAKALADYYAANPDFIWVSGHTANSRASEAVRVLSEAGGYGLETSDYTVTVPRAAYSMDNMAARQRELIRFEMTLSARVLRYVGDAQGGRINPNRLSGYHDFPVKPLDRVNVLKQFASARDARGLLESYHPQNPEYQALRVELEAVKASAENDIVVDAKLLLKPGESSPELPKLLQLIARDHGEELGAEHNDVMARFGQSETYVDELGPLIKAAQTKAGLKADGVIGPRTVAALAGTSRADRIAKVTYALEQLRWLPSELGDPRVFINQPAYTASFIEGGAEKLKMRVVIGKPTNQTSFFYDEIEQVDYNPYWGVPQSIIVNEMLPRLRNDPGYLDRSGYEVTDSKGRRIPSSSIDWGQYGAKVPYSVRQTPSEANALGELKILFPNKHAIYMHDTPQKALFERDTRAFSHGCVRLQDPRGMAAAVLGTDVDHIAGKLKQGHSTERVSRKIPVYVAYFTAWPDASGKVEYFDDVYDRDARLQIAIEKTEAERGPSS
ncbi:murein L,D-transpeptidase [Pseudaminobacter arsenicus]|uniref:Murein L,D-transpeptidase n=1 Tax=Borborobacter arsenicus TaxID=1851146 RepID=A0A432VCL9_9HYPH|nr:murein L,D-transpeptidase [Pseudaminobacter arsenicus]RUM99912.1 murein L,D-transpeptidase [Pseudaminobacter arsenicus]